MPEKENICSKKDFRIDTFRSGGKGGQHQNVTDSGVRIIHIESGLSAESRETRSQAENKTRAFGRLAPLVIAWWKKKNLPQKEGGGPSDEVVRSYNEKRGTVKDHRTGHTLPMEKVLNGEIGEFIRGNLEILPKEKGS